MFEVLFWLQNDPVVQGLECLDLLVAGLGEQGSLVDEFAEILFLGSFLPLVSFGFVGGFGFALQFGVVLASRAWL